MPVDCGAINQQIGSAGHPLAAKGILDAFIVPNVLEICRQAVEA